ncbi:hypothetical protein M405DRAFT_811203 [Rhizopogon salebrosus TDB-379]|nr:hypothetical protein M405DRAFT_811203 [Rhizopogon salebrosus TDB-379]
MPWDYWKQSTLYLQVIAEQAQRTVADLTSRPQRGLHSSPSVNNPRVSTQNQARYGGDTTSSDYPPVPHRCLSNAGPGFLGSHQLDQRNAQRDSASNVASPQLSANVYSHSSYSSASNLGLSDTSMTYPWLITPVQEFQYEFHGTHGERPSLDNYERVPRDDVGLFSGGTSLLPHGIPQHIQSAAVLHAGSLSSMNSYNSEPSSTSFVHSMPESPQNDITMHQGTTPTTHEHPVHPVNDHSESRTDGRMVCQWDDDNGQCGKTIIVRRDEFVAHLRSYHFKSSMDGDTLVQCRWMGCRKSMRRDTMFRHICEVHFERKRRLFGGGATSQL